MKNPKVTVCIPVYNGSKYIRQTIDSVLKQTFTDFELFVIDNKSTDNTVDIVKSIQDERIKLITNTENYGLVGNWNICLKLGTGEYFHMLCADDLLGKTCLEQQVKMLDEYPDMVMVIHPSYVIDDDGNVVMKRRALKGTKSISGKKMMKKSFHKGNIYGEPSIPLLRRTVLKQVGEFSTELCYSLDWDYWLRASAFGKIGYIDDFLSSFRISLTSATSGLLKKKKKLLEDDNLLVDRMKANPNFAISRWDVFVHIMMVRIRMYAKVLLFKIKA